MCNQEIFVPYLAAKTPGEIADGLILGCPYEGPGAFRRGADTAPRRIRRFSHHISGYHPQTGRDLFDISIGDLGDMAVEGVSEDVVFSRLEKTASSFFLEKRFLLTLGGSRAVSYPLIKAVRSVYPRCKIISFDAHSGREESNDFVGHDNLFTALLDEGVITESDLYVFGTRVGSKEAIAKSAYKRFENPPKVRKALMEQMHRLYKFPVYITVDADVMDPPFVPGSGHPVYGGIATAELFDSISLLQSLNVVGMDITEIVPPLDRSGITEIFGATLVKEALIHFL